MTLPPEQSEVLLELAARVEAASEADFVLDRDIAVAITPNAMPYSYNTRDIMVANEDGRGYHSLGVRAYTASIDTAMKLVPEGHWAEGSLGTHDSTRSAIEIHAPMTFDPVGKGWAATPALALTAAALRARSLALQPGGE